MRMCVNFYSNEENMITKKKYVWVKQKSIRKGHETIYAWTPFLTDFSFTSPLNNAFFFKVNFRTFDGLLYSDCKHIGDSTE